MQYPSRQSSPAPYASNQTENRKTKQASQEVALEQQSAPTSALLKSDDEGVVIGLPPSPRPAEPFSAPQPPYPPLDPPFDATWDLARSTIIHTGNGSGFTDGVAAAKYGVISFVRRVDAFAI